MELDPKPLAPRPLVLSHSLEAKVIKLEEIIARKDDEWEPDGENDSNYAGGAISTLDSERVADAPRDEFDKVVSQVVDPTPEPKQEIVDRLSDEEMDASR